MQDHMRSFGEAGGEPSGAGGGEKEGIANFSLLA